MGPPSYMQSVVDRNVVMRRIPVLSHKTYVHYILYCGINFDPIWSSSDRYCNIHKNTEYNWIEGY